MAAINTIEWESIKDFDDKLKEIPHYCNHPEMLPFIGKHYKEARLLLIGESHFFEGLTEEEIEYAEKGWYDSTLPENYNPAYRGNYDTRRVVNRFLTLKRTKAHSMFRNPANGIINALKIDCVSDSEAFTACAFMNYFQRPALVSHDSICPTQKDLDMAYNTFMQVAEIINPCLIVFLSQKAFNSYENTRNKYFQEIDQRVVFTAHPTCKYWNDDNGLAKFEEVIANSVQFRDFDRYNTTTISELPDMPINFKLLHKGQNRFIENEVTVKCYIDPLKDSVSEIVWHIQLDGVRFGLGYVTKQKILWFWNYSEKQYIDESSWKTDPRLNNLYEKVVYYIRGL